MYDKIIDLAVQSSLAITQETAQLIQQEKLASYAALPVANLAERILPTLEMQLRYLRTGNVDEWQTTCIKLVEDRIKQGLDYQEVIRAGQLLVQSLNAFFERELKHLTDFDGQPAAKLLSTIQRRLQGLSIVATAAATSVGIKSKLQKPDA